MNIPDLEALIAVVEIGSIGAASLRLNLTQPAVTRRVQSLEQALGLPLLDRSSKPPRLTIEGRAPTTKRDGSFMPSTRWPSRSSRTALHTATCGSGSARRSATSRCPRRSTACAPSTRSCTCAPRSAGPRTSCSPCATGPSTRGHSHGRRQDAAFGLSGEPIATDPAVVVASHDLPIRAPTALDDLASTPWVLDHDGCSFQRVLRDASAARQRSLVPGIVVGGAELQLSLIARGHGVGMVLPRMLERSAFKSSVRVVPVTDFQPVFTIWFVHSPYLDRLAAPVRSFREALSAEIA